MVRIWIGIVLLTGAAVATAADASPTPLVDLLIRNGMVLDGLGSPPVEADVVIDAGAIRFVGRAERSLKARQTIDAAGRIVAPGFIDPHGHGDPLATPAFEQFLAAGVTTVALGQDGVSPMVDDLGAWLDDVATRGVGVHIAMFVGFGTLRRQAGMGAGAEPEVAAIEALQTRLEAALDRAFGVSLGSGDSGGAPAGELERRMVARIAGARGRVVMARPRRTGDAELDGALDELVRMGNHARVHVAHLQSVGGRGPQRAEQILMRLDRARHQGVRITADVCPPATACAEPGPDGGSVPVVGLDPALQERLLADPDVAVASDGGTAPDAHTAFAWLIEDTVRTKGVAGLPEAVRRMTSLPAAIIGLSDRGRLQPGAAADVVIFDPARVRAGSSPEGFDVVIVGGSVAREGGRLAPGVHGSVLRP